MGTTATPEGAGLGASERSWLNDALAALHSQGVATELSSDALEQSCSGRSRADLPMALASALLRFYRAHPREAVSEGVFIHPARVDRHAVEALNEVVASGKTLDTKTWSERPDGNVDFSAMLPDCTELSFVLSSIDDLVAAFNSASHKTGDSRVFVSLRTGTDDSLYLLADMKRVDALMRFLPFE